MPKNWKRDHNPNARPLGCNGRYGESGRKAHARAGTENCDKCRASSAHYARERTRGQGNRAPLKPCGTMAAAVRHRNRGERPCLPCYAAEAKYHADLREKRRQAPENLHQEGERLARLILSRRRSKCLAWRRHTPGHCPACGVHSPAGRLQITPPDVERIAA